MDSPQNPDKQKSRHAKIQTIIKLPAQKLEEKKASCAATIRLKVTVQKENIYLEKKKEMLF